MITLHTLTTTYGTETFVALFVSHVVIALGVTLYGMRWVRKRALAHASRRT